MLSRFLGSFIRSATENIASDLLVGGIRAMTASVSEIVQPIWTGAWYLLEFARFFLQVNLRAIEACQPNHPSTETLRRHQESKSFDWNRTRVVNLAQGLTDVASVKADIYLTIIDCTRTAWALTLSQSICDDIWAIDHALDAELRGPGWLSRAEEHGSIVECNQITRRQGRRRSAGLLCS